MRSSVNSLYHTITTFNDPDEKLLKIRIKSNHLPRWINHEVKKAMYERDRFHKLKDWYNYKTMRNKVRHLIRKNKKD